MKKTGAWLATYALEQLGVRFTFGIPGVHTTELYDELGKSEAIEPVLVTHELGAAFMADGISRTTDGIGVLAVVPAAGVTHAMSGIAEAYLDGIPMLVITGGTRRDTMRHYQLHEMDQMKLVEVVTKKAWLVREHAEIIPTLFEAYETAMGGTPGPVLVELPSELLLFQGEVGELPMYCAKERKAFQEKNDLKTAIDLIRAAKRPGIYAGWGARNATQELIELANLLGAPVATTMQGLSVFPASHPLHVGMGIGTAAVPAAKEAFRECDLLITVGARFSELATGSYSFTVPEKHIHVDINGEVFGKNYPATVGLEGDASAVLKAILVSLEGEPARVRPGLKEQIKKLKDDYFSKWTGAKNVERVSPGWFFKSLRSKLPSTAYVVLDDGNHTFLAAELFPCELSKRLISPTDFNAMGYCIPAAIAAKLAHPDERVVGVVGDGAALMTGNEILTATTLGLGVVFFVFYDGELGQISQFQKIPMNRKVCTVLGKVSFEGMALMTGAHYLKMSNDAEIDSVIDEAFRVSDRGQPVIVDVKIDYSKKTAFTRGVVKTNLSRFPLGEKVRFIGRAAKRHLLG